MTDFLSGIPTELLLDIFGRELGLSPTAAFSHTLLPIVRLNAWKNIRITRIRALGKLGRCLAVAPALGELIESLEVLDDGKVDERAPRDVEGELLAFELMSKLRKLKITTPDLAGFLSAARLRTQAFQHVHTLILHSEPSIPYSSLRHLHLAQSLRELIVTSPMRYSVGAPASAFPTSSVHSLSISSEPSAEFTAFLSSLHSLSSLRLSSTDPDVGRVFTALGSRARSSLERIDFTTFSHLSRNIDEALLDDFPRLEELEMYSSQCDMSPIFFRNLALAAPRLRRLHFRGPGAPSLEHIVDFLADPAFSAPATLDTLSVDIGIGGGAKVVLWTEYRRSEEVSRLAEVCQAIGVRLEGSILVALDLLKQEGNRGTAIRGES